MSRKQMRARRANERKSQKALRKIDRIDAAMRREETRLIDRLFSDDVRGPEAMEIMAQLDGHGAVAPNHAHEADFIAAARDWVNTHYKRIEL